MPIIENGTLSNQLPIDVRTRSARVNNRPIISNSLGSYQIAMQSGVMAAGLAAAAEVYQFRYGAANLCLIEKVIFDGLGSIVAFAAGVAQFRLFTTRTMTASGSGGTPATLTGNNGKLKITQATTGVSDIRISSTAALTSPAGDTPDAQPSGALLFGLAAVAGAGQNEGTLFDAYSVGHPIVLAQNEGLILQATVPATGTWTFGVTVKWSEVTVAEWEV